jgi:hypothetical protein
VIVKCHHPTRSPRPTMLEALVDKPSVPPAQT